MNINKIIFQKIIIIIITALYILSCDISIKFQNKNGWHRTYYKSGAIKEIIFYKNGKIEGLYKEYYNFWQA